MSVVAELLAVTTRLYELLEGPVDSETRDQIIAAIEKLLGERDSLIQQMQPPFSEEEQEIGRKIVVLDGAIYPKLQRIKLQIQGDLKLINQKKTANENYMNPYQSLSMDGTFYDKKR